MTTVRAGYLPASFPGAAEIAWATRRYDVPDGGFDVEVPSPTPSQLSALADFLRARRADGIARLSTSRIVDAIDAVVCRLLDPASGERAAAVGLLRAITGYDEETVKQGVRRTLETFRRPQLLRALAQDFPSVGILDGFVPQPGGGLSRAYGPALATHVWAGNVPGLPAWSLIAGLLVKSPTLGKTATAEPYFAGWLASAIARESPELADAMAIVSWKGGDAEAERAAFGASEVVVAYGGGEAIRDLRRRVPSEARLLAYGPKLSFGYVGKEALDARQGARLCALAALDVARYDQQGCYSPQQWFVDRGGRIEPQDFAAALARELENLRRTRPPRSTTAVERTAKAAFGDGASAAWTAEDGSWKVVYEEPAHPLLSPSALDRTVRVTAVDGLEAVVCAAAPYRAFLQTVGAAVSPERLLETAGALGDVGVTRVCAVGEMVSPEAGWHHDGRFMLADLVRLVDVDRSAETDAERYAEYRE
ncbi:acyl-CoA reductase [Paenibacillus sp. TRM 82003]|nr:acyl-CoA reductase [Paenibacillus sp. TRM 82003]